MFCWLVMWAVTEPSAARVWLTRWKASAVVQMSPPPPTSDQVPLAQGVLARGQGPADVAAAPPVGADTRRDRGPPELGQVVHGGHRVGGVVVGVGGDARGQRAGEGQGHRGAGDPRPVLPVGGGEAGVVHHPGGGVGVPLGQHVHRGDGGQVGAPPGRVGQQLVGLGPLGGPPLDDDPVGRGGEHAEVGGLRVGAALADHDPGLGEPVGVPGLGHHPGADRAVAVGGVGRVGGEGLVLVAVVVEDRPDVRAAGLDGPRADA